MDLPQEVFEFAKWSETDGSDTQKIDKLASIVGLQRLTGETDNELLDRITQQRFNPYNLGDVK